MLDLFWRLPGESRGVEMDELFEQYEIVAREGGDFAVV
jgi:hypothetical protein